MKISATVFLLLVMLATNNVVVDGNIRVVQHHNEYDDETTTARQKSLRTALGDFVTAELEAENEVQKEKELLHDHSLNLENNPTCAQAKSLPGFVFTEGSLDGNAPSQPISLPACGDATAPSGGQAWYRVSVDSNRSPYTDTCAEADFDTQITIYRGTSCSNLQCVAGNDDGCGTTGLQSKVGWSASAGQTYYIVVHGRNGAYGDFTLYYTQN